MEEDFVGRLGMIGDFAGSDDQAVHRGKALTWDIVATFSSAGAFSYFKTKKDRGMMMLIIVSLYMIF